MLYQRRPERLALLAATVAASLAQRGLEATEELPRTRSPVLHAVDSLFAPRRRVVLDQQELAFSLEHAYEADTVAVRGDSTFDVTGKQLILYLTQVPASGAVDLQYRLKATMPVTADDGGSSVYPYYEPDAKSTSPSRKLVVTAN